MPIINPLIPSGTNTKIKQYNISQSITLLPVTDPAQPEQQRRITVSLSEEEASKWMIAGLCSWELKNSGTRAEAIPVYAFTMDNKTSIRICFKTPGTSPVTINSGQVGILLIKRE